MILEYEIAKLNIRIITDFDILQSGSSPLFASTFEKSDVDVNIILGDINVDENSVYSTDCFDVFRNQDNSYSLIYYLLEKGKKKYHFLTCENNCVLSSNCKAPGKDMFHFWGMIDMPHIFVQHHRLLLHCSYIISDGKAVLFCGKSGIGKSTQADLWEKFGNAEIINGDKAVIFSEDGRLYAASLPISGTSKLCLNKTAEVKAVVFLSQDNVNEAETVCGTEKVSLLASNVIFDIWRGNEMIDVIELCTEFAELTEAVKYKCLPDKSSVEYLKKVIK